MMKRDMELVRKILLAIEDQYISTALINLHVDGYDMPTVAYHCEILHEAGMVSAYKPNYGDGKILGFAVGSLTWEGNNYLDEVRDDSLWRKTKDEIRKNGLPLIVNTIKTVANAFVTAAAEGVANSIIKNGGV